jgi:hypothetical protein
MTRLARPLIALLSITAACERPTAPTDEPTAGAPALVRIPTEKPSLTAAACVTGTNQMQVTVTWNGQTIDESQFLTVTLVFKGRRLPASPISQTFVGPFTTQPSFAVLTLNTFIGDAGSVPWSAWTSIGASASGAFEDTAGALRQPRTGWSAC